MTYKKTQVPFAATVFTVEQWHDEAGRLHREDGPAYRVTDTRTGICQFEEYYQRDRLHNASGPAVVLRHRGTGAVLHSACFVEGKPVDKDL